MILIFAVDNNWNIGVDGDMLAAIPDDLTRFRLLTEENIIIMGRKTLEAIPGQGPLPDRTNILFTRNKSYEKEGFHLVHSLDDLGPLLESINPNKEKEVFVIGGQSIVDLVFPLCTKAYITKILKAFPNADTSIPNLDKEKDWRIVAESEVFNFQGMEYKYVNYEKYQGLD